MWYAEVDLKLLQIVMTLLKCIKHIPIYVLLIKTLVTILSFDLCSYDFVLLIFLVECNQNYCYAVVSLVRDCLLLCLLPVFLAVVYK